MTRLTALTALALASATLAAAAPALAQDYPSRPITVVVPYPPGSATDNVMRPLLPGMQSALGQPVVIENRVGANGVVGTQYVARTKPDGYTLLIGSVTSLGANAGLYKNLPYDPIKDFQPVAGLGSTSMMFMVRADAPAKDLKSALAAAAREATPLPVGYGSSSAQIALALLGRASNVRFTGVPYKGTPQAITDLIGGSIPMAIVDVGNGVPHIKSGRLVALAISAGKRSSSAPDVPLLQDHFPGTQLVTWIGMVAPAGTPLPIAERLNRVVTTALGTPEVRAAYATVATEIETMTPAEMGRRMVQDQKLWLDLIRIAGIQPE